MEHVLENTIALLSRTPSALDALLRDLPESWTHRNEGGESWTAYDVVGHLIYADREDWLPRARKILKFGESEAFDPFDRLGHVAASKGKTLPQLLDEFVGVRSECLAELRTLDLNADQLALRGKHPSLGPVRLSELLSTWAVHDLTHLHQISRTMAHQYREAVGPFREYLGVLQCAGHSS